MLVIPVLQLLGGRCVSLAFSDLDNPSVWAGDPVEKARGFVREGAERLHVTDLDAVRGDGDNAALIERIIREAGVPVQVGGGLRGDEQVARWIEAGAARVVLGTNAVRFPDWAKALARAHPDQVIVSIDVWEGKVMVDGWRDSAMFGPHAMAREFDGHPFAALTVTDVDRHHDHADASLALTTQFAEQTTLPVIASGVVRGIDDVSSLRYLPNIAGVMIGRALYEKSVDLAEAIAIARPTPERPAPFC